MQLTYGKLTVDTNQLTPIHGNYYAIENYDMWHEEYTYGQYRDLILSNDPSIPMIDWHLGTDKLFKENHWDVIFEILHTDELNVKLIATLDTDTFDELDDEEKEYLYALEQMPDAKKKRSNARDFMFGYFPYFNYSIEITHYQNKTTD